MYIIAVLILCLAGPAFAQNRNNGYNPMDAMRQGWDLAEQAQEPDPRRRQPFPGQFPGPSYGPPPVDNTIRDEYDRLLMEQFLQQQFKDQIDRQNHQGRYRRY